MAIIYLCFCPLINSRFSTSTGLLTFNLPTLPLPSIIRRVNLFLWESRLDYGVFSFCGSHLCSHHLPSLRDKISNKGSPLPTSRPSYVHSRGPLFQCLFSSFTVSLEDSCLSCSSSPDYQCAMSPRARKVLRRLFYSASLDSN